MLFIALLTSFNAFAYDIKIDSIYYNVNVVDFTCEVTYKNTSYNSYSGDIVIPETVTYKNKTLRVTSIGSNAFYNCRKLKSIAIPESVTRIENYAFIGCDSLKKLIIEDGTSQLYLGYSNSSYYRGAFYHCPIDTAYIGRNLSYNYAPFYDNYNSKGNGKITNVTFGSSVTTIPNSVLRGCSNLKSITIGKSVSEVKEYAFYGCNNLESIYLEGTVPPTVSNNNFANVHYMNTIIYVPQGSLDTYQGTDIWKVFWDIQEQKSDNENKKCSIPSISYKNRRLIFECETEGAEFVSEITSCDFDTFYNYAIDLTATYDISVYATAEGHENSDIVNATLCWVECECENNDDTNAINIPATAALVTSANGTVTVNCSLDGEAVAIYTVDGILVGTATIENGSATIATEFSKGTIAIVKIGKNSIKAAIQ